MLDLLLQLLDAARLTVATGETLDYSGFHIWLTSNVGSSELTEFEHSSESTLERHVLSRAMTTFRPEIVARIAEKIVFHRLDYETQLEIAGKFVRQEIAFLAGRGHRLELGPEVMGYLVRKGFHPRLGARPMRDTVEKLVGDAVARRLLEGCPASGRLAVDEAGDRLQVV